VEPARYWISSRQALRFAETAVLPAVASTTFVPPALVRIRP
jgi:hypothetical protein